MALDFTTLVLRSLYDSLKSEKYVFQTYHEFNTLPKQLKTIVLRHDVDAKKLNSLHFATLQNSLNIKGTYYFRNVPQSFDERVIRQIADLGHEIGYHYETMDTFNGDVDKSYEEFCRNLEKFRSIAEIQTICMHGSPLSKHDNRDIWKKYSYRSLGIIAEPYFDLDFNKTFYLTDTGRRWDGNKVSIRDKVMKSGSVVNADFIRRRYRSTDDIVKHIIKGDFPGEVMMTFHPQRWTDSRIEWIQELLAQNIKNLIKRVIVKKG